MKLKWNQNHKRVRGRSTVAYI